MEGRDRSDDSDWIVYMMVMMWAGLAIAVYGFAAHRYVVRCCGAAVFLAPVGALVLKEGVGKGLRECRRAWTLARQGELKRAAWIVAGIVAVLAWVYIEIRYGGRGEMYDGI